MSVKESNRAPQIGEGIFLTKDVSEILRLPYPRVRRWMLDFWDNRFGQGRTYSFGEKGNKAINFLTLIEFYTYYRLRQEGVKSRQIQKAHSIISKELGTKYPFATSIRTDGKAIWYEYLDDLVRSDGKRQLDVKKLIDPFLHKIDFGSNNLAVRYYPLKKSKNIVVDPKHQFGQPTILGTNISVSTILKLYKGGESKKNICALYNLNSTQVSDALRYYKRA